MKTKGFMQYLAGALFLAFSLYQLSREEYWEFSLYAMAGAAFITMGLLKENRFPRFHGILNVLSWVLIISAGILLIFLVRTDV